MNMEELCSQRIQLFKDAVRKEKKPARVPHLSNIITWKVTQSPYTLSEVMHSWDLMLEVQTNFHKDYSMDVTYDTGTRNPLLVTELLGNKEYIVNDEANSLNIMDQCMMTAEEYDELIADPRKYIWEKMLPRKYPAMLEENGSEAFAKMLREYRSFGEYGQKINKVLTEEFGMPPLIYSDFTAVPFSGYELMFNFFRGIKGLSLDLRRKKAQLLQAIETLNQLTNYPLMDHYPAEKAGTTPNACFDGVIPMLGHTILNPRQFEEFYWPYLEKMGDFAVRYDKLFYVFCEGDGTPFIDFFKRLPKGHFAVHCEQTDIFELKEKAPNVAVVGGMPFSLLANGTPEECVAYAKRLIDELGADGGYIFSEDKMISFRNECRPETLKAVCDFVSGYAG